MNTVKCPYHRGIFSLLTLSLSSASCLAVWLVKRWPGKWCWFPENELLLVRRQVDSLSILNVSFLIFENVSGFFQVKGLESMWNRKSLMSKSSYDKKSSLISMLINVELKGSKFVTWVMFESKSCALSAKGTNLYPWGYHLTDKERCSLVPSS